MHDSLRHGSSTTTDAHFFYSAPVPLRPADNAGEVVLASSSSHASVNWHSLMEPLARARTDAQNDSRTAEGPLDTFEDRTLGIMQQIRDLSDRYDRLAAQARSLQPSPEDPYQRLSQLYTSVRNAIDELRNDYTQYTSVMGVWEALIAALHSEDSAKASRMLRYRRFFFGYPTANTKLLDKKQMDLLEHFSRVQQHNEDIVQHREDAARATRSSRALPADNAGGRRALSANEQQRTNLHREKQPLSTENTRKNAPDEQRPPTHRMGWKTARGSAQHRPQRSEADNATAAAPSRSLEADNAARLSRGRGPSPDRIKALMSSFASSAGAGRTTTFSSGPLQVGADGKPLSRSSANAKRPPSASGAAHLELHHTLVNQAEVLIVACALCSGPHPPSQCPRYDTTRRRLQRTRKLRYCFLCLEGSHQAGSCPKKTGIPCRHCSHGEHHPALCKDLHRRRKEVQAGLMCANKTETEQAQSKGPTGGPSTATPRAMICEPVSPTRSVRQEDCSVTWLKPTTNVKSTVKPWCLLSAPPSSTSNSKPNRPSRHRNGEPLLMDCVARAAPTTVIDENTLAKDKHASDSDELLFMQKRLRQTDMCSTPDEMVQFDRTTGNGSGAPDAEEQHELHVNEDVSPNKPSGSLNDSARVSSAEPTTRFAPARHREDDAPTPLLECLITTAKNPWTDDSCDAVIVFDSSRTTSVITKQLVRALKLPAASTPTADFPTFTGYHTCVDLLSRDGFRLSIDHIATGRLPDQLRTVLVDEDLLRALRRSLQLPDVIYAQPHLLIGLDLMQRVQY